jgi:hypothetical protein
VKFAVCDDLARRINGAVNSGREIALIFRLRARRVVEVRVQAVWVNDEATRSFSPDSEPAATRT